MKFQFMILNREKHRRKRMAINFITVKESNEVILLDITIDNKLLFKKHIENLCRTAQYKLHALTRTRKYLTLDKAILLRNTFINSATLISNEMRTVINITVFFNGGNIFVLSQKKGLQKIGVLALFPANFSFFNLV